MIQRERRIIEVLCGLCTALKLGKRSCRVLAISVSFAVPRASLVRSPYSNSFAKTGYPSWKCNLATTTTTTTPKTTLSGAHPRDRHRPWKGSPRGLPDNAWKRRFPRYDVADVGTKHALLKMRFRRRNEPCFAISLNCSLALVLIRSCVYLRNGIILGQTVMREEIDTTQPGGHVNSPGSCCCCCCSWLALYP